MSLAKHAILTVVTAVLLGRAGPGSMVHGQSTVPPQPLEEKVDLPAPVRVSFRLLDGVRVNGTMTGWDTAGLDGSFGRRSWGEIRLDDARRTVLQVLDRDDSVDWVRLGRIMLRHAGEAAEQRAEQAFRNALEADPAMAPLVAEAREDAAVERRRAEVERRSIEAQRLTTTSPEAAKWPEDPWPALTREQRAEALAEIKATADAHLQPLGLAIRPVEANHFLVYDEGPRIEAARLARALDLFYLRLAQLFGLAAGENIFWGKAAVFVIRDREQTRLLEAQAFNHLTSRSTLAVCHFDGPRTFIVAHHPEGEPEPFLHAVLREAGHAFMHRYRTPRRLPPWANEGLIEVFALAGIDHALYETDLRSPGHQYIRGGGDLAPIMNATFASGWPGRGNVASSCGMLLVEFLLDDKARFVRWADRVKIGDDWRDAMRTVYGSGPRALAESATRFYLVND